MWDHPGSVLATDISSNILAFAEENAQNAGLHNVQARLMDAENLELEDQTFDAGICRLGLMYLPDQAKALSGIYRVLEPEGRKLASMVFSPAEKNPFFSLPVAIVRRRAHLPPPLPAQPGPFSLGGSGIIERLYRQARLPGGANPNCVRTPTLSFSLRVCALQAETPLEPFSKY